MKMLPRFAAIAGASMIVTACAQGDQITNDTQPFAGIGEDETITLLGTEPFWDVEITGSRATYSSPENLDGTPFTVSRFAGNNGLGFTGELDGKAVTIAVTPGSCNDGMSDREFPYTATVEWGDTSLQGCGYTDAQPFTGEETP